MSISVVMCRDNPCLFDAVRHAGPAYAMKDLLQYFEDYYERLVFVPVDMPLIEIESLRYLIGPE